MFASFSHRPEARRFRNFSVSSPPKGQSTCFSVAVAAPIVRLHFAGRSVPCLGPGCPLCPAPSRSMAFLPAVVEGTRGLRLLAVSAVPPVLDAALAWCDGWCVSFSRGDRVVRVLDVRASGHFEAGPVNDQDVAESLARCWGLPSPADFANEAAWISACFTALSRR